MPYFPRVHLFEISDHPRCPQGIRNGMTDYLQFATETLRPYRLIADRLAHAIDAAGADRIIDLGSGAGGPWLSLHEPLAKALGRPVPVVLTDLRPNEAAGDWMHQQTGGLTAYHPAPVDLTAVPETLTGFRTFFSSFHHFDRPEAVAILRDAVAKGQGIGIFEATSRRVAGPLFMLPVPLVVWLSTPFIRPFRWRRLLWTYLVPGVPLIGLFDGIVSCLRTYTPGELLAMAGEADPNGRFAWEAKEISARGMLVPATYLIGTPKRSV